MVSGLGEIFKLCFFDGEGGYFKYIFHGRNDFYSNIRSVLSNGNFFVNRILDVSEAVYNPIPDYLFLGCDLVSCCAINSWKIPSLKEEIEKILRGKVVKVGDIFPKILPTESVCKPKVISVLEALMVA